MSVPTCKPRKCGDLEVACAGEEEMEDVLELVRQAFERRRDKE